MPGHGVSGYKAIIIPGPCLLGPPGLRQPGFYPQRILVIELLQDLVRQRHAIELPEGVVAAVIVEILVVRLEDAPVIRVFGRLVGVLAEHDAVLVLGEKLRRREGLAAELVEDRRHFEHDIGKRVQQMGGALEIVAIPGEVRGNEARLRMLGEHVVALLHQLLERRVVRRGAVAIGEKNSCGSAVWMMTGMFSSPARSHTGSSAGSSTARRDPSAFVLRRPSSLNTFRPIAPFFTAWRRSASAFCSQAGVPAPFQATLAKTRKRSL